MHPFRWFGLALAVPPQVMMIRREVLSAPVAIDAEDFMPVGFGPWPVSNMSDDAMAILEGFHFGRHRPRNEVPMDLDRSRLCSLLHLSSTFTSRPVAGPTSIQPIPTHSIRLPRAFTTVGNLGELQTESLFSSEKLMVRTFDFPFVVFFEILFGVLMRPPLLREVWH